MRKQSLWLFVILTLSLSSVVRSGEPTLNNVYENGITLTITSKPFEAKAHVIKKCGQAVCLVDGKPVYGTYGKTPKEEVTNLVFEKQGKKVALDVSSMYNPNVTNSNIKKYVSVMSWGDDTYEVTGYFSLDDGDDSMYICRWLIMQGGSIRNHFSDYESLVTLTTKVQEDFKIEQGGVPITGGDQNGGYSH